MAAIRAVFTLMGAAFVAEMSNKVRMANIVMRCILYGVDSVVVCLNR